MERGRRRACAGMSMIELMIALLASSVMMLAVGAVLYHGGSGWYEMYRRASSPVVADAYAARAAFDGAVRKSTYRKCVVGTGGSSLEVYFYAGIGSASLDRYANFHVAGADLLVSEGPLQPGTLTPMAPDVTRTVAHDVSSCTFASAGMTASMHLAIDDGRESLTVDTTAVRHNE